MSPTEYIILVFFWVCFVSVDSARRTRGNFDLSAPRPTVFSRILAVLNVLFLQWLFPLYGFVYFFGDPIPVEIRKFIYPCGGVIAIASLLVNFGYWLGFKQKPVWAEVFLVIMLCVGAVGYGCGLESLDRKYDLFSNGERLAITVGNLSYGVVCLRHIMKRIGAMLEERRSINYQI